jgi:hypothetical protein
MAQSYLLKKRRSPLETLIGDLFVRFLFVSLSTTLHCQLSRISGPSPVPLLVPCCRFDVVIICLYDKCTCRLLGAVWSPSSRVRWILVEKQALSFGPYARVRN